MNIRFLTLAQKEVDESVRWYDERANLGRGFLDDSIAAFARSNLIRSLRQKSTQEFDAVCCTVFRMP